MKKLAVLVADRGYMVPSLHVVRQLAAWGATELADIRLYLTGIEPETLAAVKAAFEAPGIVVDDFGPLPTLPETVRFRANHVPPSTLARLSLGDRLEARYEQIVYLDGDLQIVGDPRPLFQVPVPEDRICAARDTPWIYVRDGVPTVDDLEGLGLPADGYFNAGVIAASRRTWQSAEREALAFFLANSELCRSHDQSALNVTFKDRLAYLSPVYNFHRLYHDDRLMRRFRPRILHFTGHAKPWSSLEKPFRGRFVGQYRALLDAHPALRPYLDLPRIGAGDRLARAPLRAIDLLESRIRGFRRERLLAEHLAKDEILIR